MTSETADGGIDHRVARLRRGQRFEQDVVEQWQTSAEGDVAVQYHVVKPSGRRGRIDIHVRADPAGSLVAVAEVKASDWDAMTERAVRRNVHRQIKQIHDYVDAEVEARHQVSPGVIFPEQPRTPGRREVIEALFDQQGIAVVWEDESVDEHRKRTIDGAGRAPSTGTGTPVTIELTVSGAPGTSVRLLDQSGPQWIQPVDGTGSATIRWTTQTRYSR